MPSIDHALNQHSSVQTMRRVETPTLKGVGRFENGIHKEEAHDQDLQDGRQLRSASHLNTLRSDPSTALDYQNTAAPETSTHGSGHVSSAQNDFQSSLHPRERHRSTSRSRIVVGLSDGTSDKHAPSFMLPPLQANTALEESDQMQPLTQDDPQSFDLVTPADEGHQAFSLEWRSQQLFSRDHLLVVFSDPSLLLKFTAFLGIHRPQSVPVLVYYLDALKALKAISYANAIAEALGPISGHDFTLTSAEATVNSVLEQKAAQAFDVLVREDLPAYITYTYIRIVSLSISRRITGTLAPHLREASDGLAEVFCLTDPSRADNPIVFASEGFNTTTQYGMNHAIGRNCRFLQGPNTNPISIKRIRDSVKSGKEHCEVFLNYRRDGSPFMNLLMIAPLYDSRGDIRYHIGAQIDVSGLVKACTDLESLQRLVNQQQSQQSSVPADNLDAQECKKDEFRELSEMLNMGELDTVRQSGGRMHREQEDDDGDSGYGCSSSRPRLLLKETSVDLLPTLDSSRYGSGKLSGVYQHYLLIRPYPSLRILFASPTLRVPGILQSPFMTKIGGSSRVRSELLSALAECRGVTAKVRWVSRADENGRSRWIHCTPLLGSNGQIGVWMVVLIDDEEDLNRRWKQAPPVDRFYPRQDTNGPSYDGRLRLKSSDENAGSNLGIGSMRGPRSDYSPRIYNDSGGSGTSRSLGSSSPHSVGI